MVVRLRVGSITLTARSRRFALGLELPRRLLPFRVSRGSDIRLELVEAPVPFGHDADLLFDSGGTWRVYRHGRGLLYRFRSPSGRGPAARGLAIDPARRRGALFLPPSDYSRRRGFALSYPLDELLFQHHAARHGAIVTHACALVVEGQALLFCGRSGAGKTTMARLWRRHVAGARILSDDRVVLGARRGRLWAWGTPWHGSGRFASPEARPLGAVFFLQKARRSGFGPVSTPAAAAELFVRSFPPPWERVAIARVLQTCGRVASRVPCFRLRFRPDRSALEAALDAVGRGVGR